MSTLYELTTEYQELLAMAEDPEIDEQAFADTLEALQGEIEEKAESYAVVMKELKAEADKFDAEGKRLLDHVDQLENRIKRMKAALMGAMKAIDVSKIQTEHFRVSVVNNGGLQPLKITGDVPDAFKMIEYRPDLKAIRTALDEGFELSFAHLEERGTHLSIK
jgi:predicted nuclease with TOPRIM domain